jgi:hypothetical protein
VFYFQWCIQKLIFLHRVWKHIIYINSTIVFCIYRYTIITLLSQCSIWYLIEIPSGPSVYTPLYIMYEDTLSTFLNKLSVYCLYLLLSFLHHVWKHIAHISHQVITVCFLFSFIYLSTSCMKTHCPHLSSSYYCCFFFYNYISEVVMCTYYQNIFCLINCLIWKLIINTTLPHISHFTHFV